MRSYQALEFLKDKNIDFKYTPFDQGALVEIFDPDWLGSCSAIANEWMLRKISVDSMQSPVIEEITDPHLPHFVAVGNNVTSGEEIQKSLSKYYDQADTNEFNIENEDRVSSFDESINTLLNYIGSKKFHYGILSSNIFIRDENKAGFPEEFGHGVSFVKRDDEISWFDPNYGEITFSSFSDFKTWFKEEAKNGVIGTFFNERISKLKMKTLAEVLPQPEFTQEHKDNQNPFSKQIIKRRTEAQNLRAKVKDFSIGNYRISSFYGEKYVKPELVIENIDQETKAKNTVNTIKNSLAKNIGMFGAASSTSDKRNRLLWDLIRKAEKNEIKYTEALKKINNMHKFKIEGNEVQSDRKTSPKK